MMGALGNGRRGGRSPPLLVAALIACILLLGFNYWVSNSRNIDLQSRILEMEDRLRTLTAERERELQDKMRMEEEAREQAERLTSIENTHRRQQESTLNTWKQEKEILKLNISSSAKTVQDMKNRMKSLMEDLSKMQNELKSCQSNMDTVNKKATNDMTQCNKQILAAKEECNEKMAKLEQLKKPEKEALPVAPQNAVGPTQKDSKIISETLETNQLDKGDSKPLKPDTDLQPKKETQLDNNETEVEKEEKVAASVKKSPTPTSKPANKNEIPKRPASEDVPEVLMDIKEKSSKTADAVLDEAGILEGKEDDLVIGDGREEDTVRERKEEDAIMYDNEGEIEKQLSKIKDENQAAGQELEDDMANYNGDDDNQPESEAEKQAELIGMQ